jgi:tight adherence protein C
VNIDWMALVVTSGFLTAVFAAGGLIYSAVATERGAVRQLRRRLSPSPDMIDLAQRDRVAQLVARGLSPLAKLAMPKSGAEGLSLQLMQAGYRAPYAAQLFLASKVILAVVGALGFLWVDAMKAEHISHASFFTIAMAAIGLFLPNGWLNGRVRERQRRIEEGLPDVLDLLVTCVEAGLGLDLAVQRVAREMAVAHPELSEELTLTFLEVKAGAKRADAFHRLAIRTGVQDVKTLVATLNQTEMFGTSIATALRVQAEGLRTARMQRAEERAAVLSAKMTFPLVLCFLPTIMIVMIGPAMLNLADAFKGLHK